MKENEDEVKGEKYEHETRSERKTVLVTTSMTKKDEEILDWLTDFLGTSRSEAVRTAIRSFAGQMQALSRTPGRPKKGEEGF